MRLALLVLLIFIACGKNKPKEAQKPKERPLLSVVKMHDATKEVLPVFEKEIEDWNTLKNTATFLERFKKASANEVLSNALEFKALTKSLRDSVKPKLFTLPAMQARINILHNESLRLADMTNIPAIAAEEVHEQTNKILSAYSSINEKVNTVLRKKQFEDAINVDVTFIGLDSTKIDTISKNSIQKTLEKNQASKLKNYKRSKN